MIRYFSLVVVAFTFNYASGQCNLSYNAVNPLCYGVCDGQATVFPTGSAPFSYTWSTGENTESVDSLCAGTYTVTMTDGLGCSASISIILTEPATPFMVDVYLISNSSVSGPCEGQIGWTTSGGQPDYTINWYDCNTMDLYTNLPYFCAGEYFTVFIDDNGCSDTSDCITVTNNVIGFSEQFVSGGVAVYPNPAIRIQSLSLTLEQPLNGAIQLLNLTGGVVIPVYDGPISSGETTYNVDMSDLPAGVYLYQVIFADGKVIYQKTIKE